MQYCRAIKSILLLSAFMFVSACSVFKPAREPQVKAPSLGNTIVTERLGDDEILSRLSALPGQTLEKDTCGLFLWLRRDDAPLIFFQKSNAPHASMILDGVTQSLPRQSATGLIGFNFFENQTFENSAFKLSVRAKAEAVRSIRQGIKIETGNISITTQNGWSAALPVAGIIGCK